MANSEVSATEAIAEGDFASSSGLRRLTGFVWAGLSVIIFSGWFVATRFSVIRELRIWDITALRFGVGALLLAPTIMRGSSRLPWAAWRQGLVFSMLWGVPFVLLVALGLRLTPSADAASIAPTIIPVFAGIFGWMFIGQSQGAMRWISYAAIVVGLACLLSATALNRGAPDPTGVAALAGAGGLWAVYTPVFRASGLTVTQTAALICIWSAAYFAIFSFNRAVSQLAPSAASAIIALLPAAVAMLAVPVLAETPSFSKELSIAVIVIGVLLASGPTPSPVHSSVKI
ncbi:EamA family transporter [Rhizobium sp. SYY.PMSO]|uniref:EamA family transporter n=1 Tax=Rhizobium sp. SYY.PMSO TaxID=3382192 RepID=UPI003990088B